MNVKQMRQSMVAGNGFSRVEALEASARSAEARGLVFLAQGYRYLAGQTKEKVERIIFLLPTKGHRTWKVIRDTAFGG